MTETASGHPKNELSGKDVLWSAYYLGGSQCTLPGKLIPHFPEEVRDSPFDQESVAAMLREFSESAAEEGDDTARAVSLLARMEAGRMARVLSDRDNRDLISAHSDIEGRIENAFTTTTEFLSSHGLDCGTPVVRIVDTFPEPYQERRYAMLTADSGDRRKYGVEPGLYLNRSSVRPFYSEALVCHELIHVALGQKHPDLMGRGLEEGIAELVGSVLLSCRQVGPVPTFWIEVFNRNSDVYDVFWEHYNDYLRMAYLLYQRLGVDGLMDVVAQGRDAIKEIERGLVSGTADLPARPAEPLWFEAECADVAERLVLGFARSMIVSPVARVVADHALPGATVREIAAATGLGQESVTDAVKELAERAVVIGRRADGIVVTSSDLDLYLPAGMLRYAL